MRYLILLSFLLLFSVTNALVPTDAGICNFDYNVSGSFVMDKVTSFETKIQMIPKNCDPQIPYSISNTGNYVLLTEDDPYSPYFWSLSCSFETQKELFTFENLLEFPQSFSNEFLAFSYYADFTPEIQERTSLIVEGSKTVLEAGMKIAKWVHENVEYDRAYDNLYENEKGKASEVFETRKGVCDEFTSLFISMARSVGIPARYISGIAYSDVYAGYGMHAWAEFFAGTWIPVDLTFGELGIIDATHVPLTFSLEGNVSPITMTWTGYSGNSFSPINPFPNDPSCVLGPVDFSIFADGECEEENKVLEAEFSIDRLVVSDNDYFMITYNITNPYDSYLVVPIRFIRVREIEMIYGNYEDYLLIPPNSKSSKKYLIYVIDLPNEYTYILPLTIDADFTEKIDTIIDVDPRLERRSLSFYLPTFSEGQTFNPNFEINNIVFDPNPSYSDTINLSFTVKNIGNKILDLSLNTTYSSSKQTFYIGKIQINGEGLYNFPLIVDQIGEFDLKFDFYDQELSLSKIGMLVRANIPNITLFYSGKTEFGNEEIKFNISKGNCASGNIYVRTDVAGLVFDQKTTSFEIGPEYFFPGENNLNITFLCLDKYGTSFYDSILKKVNIEVSGMDYIIWLIRAAIRRIINLFEPKIL